jgi:REP element-mobilizing transposase RayT
MHKTSPLIYPNNQTLRIRYRGRIPHWELDLGVYFITFRLADSLPREARERLIEKRMRLLPDDRSRMTPLERAARSARFAAMLDRELDSSQGQCFLADPRIAALVVDDLHFYEKEKYRLIAWSVVPNHVHVVMQLFRGRDLSSVLHSWKSHSANEANGLLGRKGRFWQREYYDHIVRDEREPQATVRYTVENPAEAGLQNWAFSGWTTWWA